MIGGEGRAAAAVPGGEGQEGSPAPQGKGAEGQGKEEETGTQGEDAAGTQGETGRKAKEGGSPRLKGHESARKPGNGLRAALPAGRGEGR